MRYSALFLDFYGTLVEEDDAIIRSIFECAGEDSKEFGNHWSELFSQACTDSHAAIFRSQRDIELDTLNTLFQEFSLTEDPVEISQGLFRYWRQPTPYPESSDFLKRCPIPICIVSNIDTADILQAADHLGWRFERLITSQMVRAYKPRREIFEAAMKLMDVSPKQILHVGDSWSSDIAGASALGIDTAWINRRHRPLFDNRLAPTYMIENLDQLIPRLT